MAEFKECANYDMCLEVSSRATNSVRDGKLLNCEGCHTYEIYKKGFIDGVKALASKLNELSQERTINIEIR